MRCRCTFRYVLNFTTASCGFSVTARISYRPLSAGYSEFCQKVTSTINQSDIVNADITQSRNNSVETKLWYNRASGKFKDNSKLRNFSVLHHHNLTFKRRAFIPVSVRPIRPIRISRNIKIHQETRSSCSKIKTHVFSARQHICYSALYAIARPSVCPSVCPSHGWISQRRLKLGSRNLHHRVAP